MNRVIFESTLKSLAGINYRVRLYGKDYIGLYAEIIGGSGTVFFLKGDWRDYLQLNQAVFFDVLEPQNEDNIQLFNYNEGLDRTEITVFNVTFAGQEYIYNDVDSQQAFTPTFAPKIIDLTTEYVNSEDYLLSPLMTSSAEIVYANVQEDTSGVQTAFFDRFVDFYLQSDDDTMRMTIEREDAGFKLEWAGNLVVDLIEWDNESSPRAYTFKAIDGIDRLKDVEYPADVTDLKNLRLKEIIIKVLALNGLDFLWGAQDTYIRESIEYQAEDVTGVNASDSPLDYTYAIENIFIQKEDDKSERIFLTGYDVLKGLMECFSGRIIHNKGAYYIQQIRNYDTTTIANRDYVKSGTYVQGNYTHSNNTLRPLAGGKFGYLYGVKEVRIESENKAIINATKDYPTLFVKFIQGTIDALVLNFREVYLGDIQKAVINGQKMMVQFALRSLVPPYSTVFNRYNWIDADIVARLFVYEAGGTKYLKGSDTINPYWADDNGNDRFYEKKLATRGRNHFFDEIVRFETPPLPYDMTDVVIDIHITALHFRTITQDGTNVMQVKNIIIALPPDEDSTKMIIKAVNPNTQFTKDLQLDNLIINEGNSAVQINNFAVNENYNGSVESLVVDSPWDGQFEFKGTLSGLRVQEAFSLQHQVIRKYMGAFEGKYYPFETIPYDGVVFACSRIQNKYSVDENEGDWFQVLISRVGISATGTKYGTIGDPQEVEQGFRIARELDRGVGILNEDIPVAVAATEIVINSTGGIRKGDTLQLISETADVMLTLIADQDMGSSDSPQTLTVQPFDLDNPILGGADVVYGYKKTALIEKLRFDTLQHTDVATVPATVTDMEQGEITFVGKDIFVKVGNEIYRHSATLFLP